MDEGPFKEISIPDYQAQFTGDNAPEHLLVDVREMYEFDAGHLPGAINIPMSEIQYRYDEMEPDQTIILVCQTANRSGMVAEFLAGQGYHDVYNLLDGTVGWMMRGLPIEKP
jgi:rhodanese-related sulfurtransferase